MTVRRIFIVAFASILFGLLVNVGAYAAYSPSPIRLLVASLASFLFVGLAYDLAELITAAVSGTCFPAKLSRLNTSPRVAILYVTRHDANVACLATLAQQDYPCCTVFALDDSDDERQMAELAPVVSSVCRRSSRRGYKAGNLNHWLERHGPCYDYFVIGDCDSKLPPSFVSDMLRYAEHPTNTDIAIFQSSILPWNVTDCLPRALAVGAELRVLVASRIANSLNAVVSYGHNNLTRTRAVLAAGGFDETLSAEDTSMSLRLNELGLSCRLVDVISYDSEPASLIRYFNRSARWFEQTIEILRRPWTGTQYGPKIAVARALLSYALHLALPVLLLLTTIQPTDDVSKVMASLRFIVAADRYDLLLVWAFPLVVFSANLLLQCGLLRRSGVGVTHFLAHVATAFAISSCTAPWLAAAVFRACRGRPIVFRPTNECIGEEPVSRVRDWWRLSWFPFAVSVVGLAIAAIKPWTLVATANAFWLLVFTLSPWIVWRVHASAPESESLR